jgi:hypothetical protein
MVVVLEGGAVDDGDKKPHSSTYNIIGENFETDIFPVVAGSKVEIKNKGRKSPRLYSKAMADLVPGDPINKNGVRLTAAISEPYKVVDVRDHDTVHMVGRIVAFPHAYFSTVDDNGKFSIDGVPPGSWKVKLWYRDGWVSNAPATSINVAARRGARGVKITLPAKIKTGAEAQ